MMWRWRVLEPIPIRDAAPMPAAGFAGVAIEAAILNYVIGHSDPLVIEQHLDAGGSDPVMRRTAIPFIAAARLSTVIL
jgi:ABC-type taurine transport system substrate-binding protein